MFKDRHGNSRYCWNSILIYTVEVELNVTGSALKDKCTLVRAISKHDDAQRFALGHIGLK